MMKPGDMFNKSKMAKKKISLGSIGKELSKGVLQTYGINQDWGKERASIKAGIGKIKGMFGKKKMKEEFSPIKSATQNGIHYKKNTMKKMKKDSKAHEMKEMKSGKGKMKKVKKMKK